MAVRALNDEIGEIARRLYGVVPRLTRLASNNNFVFRLDFEGGLSPKVIKLAGSGERAPGSVRREQDALRALSKHGIDVPAVEFTQEDLPGAGQPFTIMSLLPGTTLEEACKSLKAPWAESGCRWAGAFVHRIGAVPPEALPIVLPAQHQDSVGYVRRSFEAESMFVPPFSTILDQAQRLEDLPGRRLIHGDYAWNQIMTDGRSFAVIDWESVTVGHPLSMLGRAVAMIREYGGAQDHLDWLIDGYQQQRPLSQADRHELHLWEMWHHVGCMGWKFVCGPDHRAHAFAMAERVKKWATTMSLERGPSGDFDVLAAGWRSLKG